MSNRIEAVHGAVGMRVRMIRETLGIAQSELARRMKLTRTSLTNIEAGRQRLQLHTVERFAQVLGTSPKQLLRGVWW